MKPSDVSLALPALIKLKRPIMLWGPPGVGKSAVVKQAAHALDYDMRDVRLALRDPIDMKGLPVVDPKKRTVDWFPDGFLPTKGKGVLFLDEINAAPQAVQAAAYQLVLDRKLGDYTLPEGWAIVAAGNRTEDRAVVHRMPSPLANRFIHVDVDVDLDDWCKWAAENGISSNTIGFARMRSELLHKFDITTNPRAFPTPRSWEIADELMTKTTKLPMHITAELISGTIGEGPASEYLAYLKHAKDTPTPDEVLLNPEKARVPEEPAALYAITTALSLVATPNNFDRLMIYIARVGLEFQILFIRSALQKDDSCSETKTFQEWSIKNGTVLT